MNIGLVEKYEMYDCKEFTFHWSGSALDVIFLIDCEKNVTTEILQTVSTPYTSPDINLVFFIRYQNRLFVYFSPTQILILCLC